MKLKLIVSSLILASLGAASADKKKKTFGDGTLPEFLVPYDVNEDGELDAEERQAARAARKEAREAKRASILETFDADGDGKLNEEEREAARADAKAKIEEKRVERFNEVDLDGDGGISLEEFSAIPSIATMEERRPESAAKIFAKMDQDESESVDQDEFLDRIRRSHRGGHGKPGPKPDKPGTRPEPKPKPEPKPRPIFRK